VKRLSDQTLYEILEVSVDAAPEEIERAHARAAALYGPSSLATYSLVSTDEAQLLNSRIEEARTVLLDGDARARYDERIGVRPPVTPPAPPPVLAPATTPWPPPAVVLATPPILLDRTVEAPPQGPAGTPATLPTQLELPAGAPEGGPGPPARPSEPAGPQPLAPGLGALTASPALTPSPAAPAAPAPIQLRHQLTAPRDLLVPEGAAWTGDMLRQVREARGLTVAVLSERTKVIRHHLESIEADRFSALPVPVYLRGILMSLARELRLDGQKVARSYLERMAAEQAASPRK
jgi:hypothetical protein